MLTRSSDMRYAQPASENRDRRRFFLVAEGSCCNTNTEQPLPRCLCRKEKYLPQWGHLVMMNMGGALPMMCQWCWCGLCPLCVGCERIGSGVIGIGWGLLGVVWCMAICDAFMLIVFLSLWMIFFIFINDKRCLLHNISYSHIDKHYVNIK